MDPARLSRFAIEREGLSLAAYDSGGNGLPVVFQHGLCGDMKQVAEAFPDKDAFRLITLECRGHGYSQSGGSFSIATFAEDVTALIKQVGAPVVLGGISMGAAIATRIAVRSPGLLLGLALVRPAWVIEAAPINMRPNAEVGELLANLPADRARAEFEAGETFAMLAREAPDNLKSLAGFFTREPLTTTAALLREISADGPGVTEAELGQFEMPALVVGTDADFIHPLSCAERLASLLPEARSVRLTPKGVDKAAHLSELHAALSAFLKGF